MKFFWSLEGESTGRKEPPLIAVIEFKNCASSEIVAILTVESILESAILNT